MGRAKAMVSRQGGVYESPQCRGRGDLAVVISWPQLSAWGSDDGSPLSRGRGDLAVADDHVCCVCVL